MNQLNPPPTSAVFYTAKRTENSCIYEYCVEMEPCHEHHRVTFSFTVTSIRGSEHDTAHVADVTTDIDKAERIFDLLVSGKASPCHLFDIITDLIV